MHAMNIFGQEFNGLQTRLKGFETRVKKEVNKELLADGIKPFENNIKALYVQVEILKKRLAKTANETMKRLKTFSKQFRSAVEEDLKGKRSSVNVFESAFEFVKSVRSLDVGLSEFGTIMLRLWQECLCLEQHRIGFMSLAVQKFIDLLAEVFGGEAIKGFEGSKKLMHKLNPNDLAKNVFQIKRFLRNTEEQLVQSRLRNNSRIESKNKAAEEQKNGMATDDHEKSENIEHHEIKTKTNKNIPNVGFSELNTYFLLSSQEMKEDRLNYFILRSWQGTDGKDSSRKMMIYLTIDQFYSVYLESEDKKKRKVLKLKASIMVDKCDVFAKREKSQVVITYVVKGVFWNSKKTLYFNLANPELEDFLRFYQKARIHLDYMKKHGKKILEKKGNDKLLKKVEKAGTGPLVQDLAEELNENECEESSEIEVDQISEIVEESIEIEREREEKLKVEGLDISTIKEESEESDCEHRDSNSEDEHEGKNGN